MRAEGFNSCLPVFAFGYDGNIFLSLWAMSFDDLTRLGLKIIR